MTASEATAMELPSALLVALSAHLDDGLLVVDERGRICLANSIARSLLPMPDDCIGRALHETGCDYRIVLLLTECARSDAVVQRDLDQLLDEREVLASAFSIITEGERWTIVMLRDVTRLRRLETVRRDFVANVSHELRTPIAAIQLLVETLQNGALEDRGEAAGFVGKIGFEVAHMRHMVEELLQLSAIESGRVPLHLVPVDVLHLIGSIERLRPLAAERSLTLGAVVSPGTPPVHGDPLQLEQLLRNLVHNAIKFTPEQGAVTITAAPLEGGRQVQLAVSDTGVGIAPEDVGRVFERFWKADRSRRRDGEGSGLGLAIARHVVDLHGGSISVREHDGAPGVTFSVTLPASLDSRRPDPSTKVDASA